MIEPVGTLEELKQLELLEPRMQEFIMTAKIHPGRILLEEYLAPKGISVWHLARDIGVPVRRIYEIVQGQRPINAEIAHRLAHYFGMSERYWLDLQARHDGKRDNKIVKALQAKQSLRYAG